MHSRDLGILFSPGNNRGSHWFVRQTVSGWEKTPAYPREDFSEGVVRQVLALSTAFGEVFRVQTVNETGVTLDSPRITVKKEAETMLYFLVVEDSEGQCLAAVYARDSSWSYP